MVGTEHYNKFCLHKWSKTVIIYGKPPLKHIMAVNKIIAEKIVVKTYNTDLGDGPVCYYIAVNKGRHKNVFIYKKTSGGH